MPQIIITRGFYPGLARCKRFLQAQSVSAYQRASDTIFKHLQKLQTFPEIGRPYIEDASLRELIIPFGATGYIVLYQYDKINDAVYVLTIRHLREEKYKNIHGTVQS